MMYERDPFSDSEFWVLIAYLGTYNYHVLSFEIKIYQDSVPLSHTILPVLYNLTILLQNLIFLPPKQAGVLKYGGE